MIEYLGSLTSPQAHVILATDDMINEELEHPHDKVIILHKEEATQSLDDDLINTRLEHEINPQFKVPYR